MAIITSTAITTVASTLSTVSAAAKLVEVTTLVGLDYMECLRARKQPKYAALLAEAEADSASAIMRHRILRKVEDAAFEAEFGSL